MRETKIYQLRQNILTILNECKPAPASFDFIMRHPLLSMCKSTRQEVLDEWNYLVNQGFITKLKGSGGEYVRVSPEGENQINQEGDLDSRIWGQFGL